MHSALVGFDGSVDATAYPIQYTQGDVETYFQSIGAFGAYIQSKAGLSCALQYRVKNRRLGGNGPFFAGALSRQGVSVTLVGMLGMEGIAAEFAPLADEGIRLVSYAEPMETSCLEFSDGKIMMAPAYQPMPDAYNQVIRALGAKLVLLQTADLVAFLNCGELDFMHRLWQELIGSPCFTASVQREKLAFFDPADFSKYSAHQTREMLQGMGRASQYRKTILSINENEALQFGQKLLDSQADLRHIGQAICQQYQIDMVVIHTPYIAMACTRHEVAQEEPRHVESPVISTGAGDHFNAGFCGSLLRGMPLAECLRLGNHSARHYLEHGTSIGL